MICKKSNPSIIVENEFKLHINFEEVSNENLVVSTGWPHSNSGEISCVTYNFPCVSYITASDIHQAAGMEEIYVTAAASGTEYSGEVAAANPVVDLLIACSLGYLCHA